MCDQKRWGTYALFVQATDTRTALFARNPADCSRQKDLAHGGHASLTKAYLMLALVRDSLLFFFGR